MSTKLYYAPNARKWQTKVIDGELYVYEKLGVCIHCKLQFPENDLIECEWDDKCLKTFCEDCWDNIEIPNGAYNGNLEFCSDCEKKRLETDLKNSFLI
jgi:hypothetical protein